MLFALYPTSMEDLMQIADENKLMPPKSTWFEPKLRSGIFLYISCVRGELWRRKNLFPAFAAPATEARQYAVNTGKKDGRRILTFMDCAYKRCVHHSACEIYKEAHRLGSEE